MVKNRWFLGRQWWVGLGAIALLPTLPVMAQIAPDSTLGAERSLVMPNALIQGAPGILIEGGARRGANLFQSFRDFNVGELQRVFFANPAGVESILGRVTGGNPSTILGTLGVAGSANLFLLNPSGIVFGPNARLDVRGSFVASTAAGWDLGNGQSFNALNPNAVPLIEVAIRPGFQAGSTYGGNITSTGNLVAGQSLTLAGQNLDVKGQVQAGDDLTLYAADTVRVRDTVATPFGAQAGGVLTVQGDRAIDILALNHLAQTPFVSGGNLRLISDGVISGDAHFASGGQFQVQTRSGTLANFTSLYDPVISSAGDVTIAGNYTGVSLLVESLGNVQFQGTVTITGPDTTLVATDADLAALVNGPALVVRAGRDRLLYSPNALPITTSGATFQAGTVPAGVTFQGNVTVQGGRIDVTTPKDITLASGVVLNVSGAVGGSVDLKSGGTFTASNQGGVLSVSIDSPAGTKGGDIRISANAINLSKVGLITTNIQLQDGTNPLGAGGDIVLRTQSLQATGGSEILAQTTSSGQGGNILITPLDPALSRSFVGFLRFSVISAISYCQEVPDCCDLPPRGERRVIILTP